MNSVELYPHNPYKPLQSGDASLSSISLKKPNPWAAIAVQRQMPEYIPGKLDDNGLPPASAQIAPDNLESISEDLSAEYPNAKTPKQQWGALTNAYDAPGRYQLLTKDKYPVTQGAISFQDPTPWNPQQKFDTAFVPSQKQMANDPRAAQAYSPERRFGALAHEMRHVNAYWNAPAFRPDPSGSDKTQKQDIWGNQYDHFPGTFTDRDMANALNDLEMSKKYGVPANVRTMNPWMGSKPKPTIDDLMKYIGTQPGYKK